MLWVPMLSTPSGSTLTAKNWHSIGVSVVSYDLAALLIKPGIDVLMRFSDLNHYVGWSEKIILQATLPAPDRSGNYLLRSPYDGSRLSFTAKEILEVIAWLKPNAVLLPQGIDFEMVMDKLPKSIFMYYAPADAPNHLAGHGVYVKSSAWLEEKNHGLHGIECCVYGPASQTQGKQLQDQGIKMLISDTPAEDACQGTLYTPHCMDEIQQKVFSQYMPYLNYLRVSTPLLYARYAVIYNYLMALK